MPIKQQQHGLNAEDRRLVYARARMSQNAINHVEGMVECSPARTPGKAALNNVVTRFSSLKNGATRVLESHTCELVFAYELELDPTVIGYYAQAPCRNIERTLRTGRRHVSAACLDFLVFRHDAVELIECKPIDWLTAAASGDDGDWRLDGNVWRHVAYENFAHQHELNFSVWSPPQHSGVYLQNLEAIYATLRIGVDTRQERVASKVASQLHAHPVSIRELQAEVDGFDGKVALWMLATQQAYGPLKSTPLHAAELFTLSADPDQAALIDALGVEKIQAVFAQPQLSNPILLASGTDVALGRQRMARVLAMRRGETPWTVRMAQLDKAMAKLEATGQNPLEACLTRYASSGNRLSRLLPEQERAAESVITQLWNRGRVRTPKNLYFAYQDACAALGVPASCRSSLYARVRREKLTKRALATGGLRGYQAVRPATDPTRRSLSAMGFGHTLFVDSSDIDNRIAPDLSKQMPAQKGKFYIGVDGATQQVMGHALVFGPARTDGLAILLRNHVRRWGHLPHVIHLDRGPENRSSWMSTFGETYNICLRFSPTAGSAWNGLAESTIKRVNQSVAHELIGSTLLDRKGRGVDGRFKSFRNAKTRFEVIREQLLAYIYEDIPNTPRPDGTTPREAQEEACALLGDFGLPCAYNEDFLLATSVPTPLRANIDKRRGIRTEEGYFTSDQLIDAMRFHDPVEPRSDCEDPTVLRVRVGDAWIKAFHSKVQTMALVSPEDKLFGLMFASVRRADARQRKARIDRLRHDRIQRANFATASQTQASAQAPLQALGDLAGPPSPTCVATTTLAIWNALEPLNQRNSAR